MALRKQAMASGRCFCFRRTVPRAILQRKKAGFPVPYERWLREDCRDLVHSVLLDRKTLQRGYFERTAIEKLLAEDFVEFGSSGRVWTRDQIFELLASETFSPVLIQEFNCALLAEHVALVTYRAVHTDATQGTHSLRSSIWVRESGEWRLQFHQGTPTS